MRILEAHSDGDRRFSALYARIGDKTIEEIYQSCKRFNVPVKHPKGQKPDYVEIKGKKYLVGALTPLYDLLWCRYLEQNPTLLEELKQYDDIRDKFASKYAQNTQDKTLKKIKERGILELKKEISKAFKTYDLDNYFKVVVAGGRKFRNIKLLNRSLSHLLSNVKKPIIIISGGAEGVDALGENYALMNKHSIIKFPADWTNLDVEPCVIKTRKDGTKYNALAGNIRNQKMAHFCDAVVCFWNGSSAGTKDMIQQAKKLNKPCRVIRYEEV